MKKLSFLLLLFTLTSLHAKTISSTFTNHNTEYKLELNYKKINPKQNEGLLLTYKVYRGNKLFKTAKREEPFISCRDYDAPKIVPLKSTKEQIGWMIEANGICGNTHSYLYEVILPDDTDYSDNPRYDYQSFISKVYPLIVPNEYGVELFYYQQEWGKGGTSTSYFVPHSIDYTRYAHLKLKEGDILDKISFLEKNAPEDWLNPSFLGLFKAGLDSKNLPLMHHALENYYDLNMMKWYKVHYANPTKENFLKKIEQTKEKLNTSISLALTAYSEPTTKEPLNFQNKNAEYYYCAFVGEGVDFNIGNKINSIQEFNKNIEWLNKLGTNKDANYYKVANLNQQIILYGYSMKEREIREIIKLDKKERVSYKKTFNSKTNETKECHWNYKSKDKLLTSTETCNDNSKRVFFYNITETRGESFYKLLSYKNNKLVEKVIHDDSSYKDWKIYDENNTLVSENHSEGSLYDTCIPFQSYIVETN